VVDDSPAPVVEPAADPTLPPPVDAAPAPAAPKRRLWLIALVAIAVVVLVLLWGGGFFSSPAGPASTAAGQGVAEPYSDAVAMAAPQARNASSGPWTITAAEGIAIPNGVSQENDASLVGSGCTFTPASGAPSSLTILGTPAGSAPGAPASWIFFAKNAAANAVLLLEAQNGAALALGEVTGSGCAETFTGLTAINSTSAEDSTSVAAAFNSAGGSAFEKGNSVTYQTFILIGASNATSGYAFWEVAYSTCPFTSTSGSGTQLTATYYAASGDPLSGPTTESQTC
jgi:hypothetical protein